MSSRSSVFPTQTRPPMSADCRPTPPDIVIYYSGITNDVPSIAQGNILFTGAEVTVGAAGIAATGKGSVFKLPYANILPGDAGAKIRCCVPAQKQKIRFTCRPNPCDGSVPQMLSLQLKPIQMCEAPQEYDFENPIMVFHRAGCQESCCQKINGLVKHFNMLYSNLGTASAVQVGSDWVMDIETKVAGNRFHIAGLAGLDYSIVVPGLPVTYSTDLIRGWLNNPTLPVECSDPATCLKVIELFVRQEFDSGSAMTSNLSAGTTQQMVTRQTIAVIFADNTNGNAARSAMITILNGGGSAYWDRLVDDNCVDTAMYYHSIVKTDAGNATAYNAIATAYSSAGILNYWRVGYVNGKSYYSILTASATPPTAVSSDVVKAGQAVVPDATYSSPCTTPTPAPTPTPTPA